MQTQEPTMSSNVKPIPEGEHSITPYLVIQGAAKAIDFYRKAFGAKEVMRLSDPKGDKVGHAELMIGDSKVMLADEYPDFGFRAPPAIGGTPVSLLLYVNDVDAVFQRAVAAGAKELRPVANQFYGDRMGTLQDPFGHVWSIATHVEDVPPEEMKRRAEASFAQA
jgi:PhnB protein